MSRITVLALAGLLAVSIANRASGQATATAASTSGAASTTASDDQAIRQVTQGLVQAFNAGKADQVAELFLSGAELTDDAGNVHKGTAALKDLLHTILREVPGGNLDHDRQVRLDGRSHGGHRGGPSAWFPPRTIGLPRQAVIRW